MKTILIKVKGGIFALIDEEDLELVNKYTWHTCDKGYPRNRYYGRMHRHIMGNPLGMVVDHINGNKLDNRRQNLRVCTQAQNCRNRSSAAGSTSKFKGVSWNQRKQRWIVSIKYYEKTVYIGSYKSEELAALCYNIASQELHGEFGKKNALEREQMHISEAVKKVMEKAEKAREDKVKQYNKEYQEKYGCIKEKK